MAALPVWLFLAAGLAATRGAPAYQVPDGGAFMPFVVSTCQAQYLVGVQAKPWAAAQAACAQWGGQLVEYSEPGDRERLHAHLAAAGHPDTAAWWVGARRADDGGSGDGAGADFAWQSAGQAVAPAAWLPGEPNDHGGREDCACAGHRAAGDGARLNDADCASARRYVCERRAAVRVCVAAGAPDDQAPGAQ
jgi:hypothetical protein